VRSINEDVAADLEAAGVAAAIEADLARADPDPDLPGPRVNFTVTDDGRNLELTDSAGKPLPLTSVERCEDMDVPFSERGGALDSAVRAACVDGVEDNFDSLKDAFADNVPLLSFMVIPVMATVFKLFYLFTGRAWLGHLIFLCHTHAYTFLLVVVLISLRIVGSFSTGLNSFLSYAGFALLLLYTPVYYFIAMRRVYAQHWLLTAIKLVALMFIYLFAILTVFTVGFAVLALTS
jgi:hypothetical protein